MTRPDWDAIEQVGAPPPHPVVEASQPEPAGDDQHPVYTVDSTVYRLRDDDGEKYWRVVVRVTSLHGADGVGRAQQFTYHAYDGSNAPAGALVEDAVSHAVREAMVRPA